MLKCGTVEIGGEVMAAMQALAALGCALAKVPKRLSGSNLRLCYLNVMFAPQTERIEHPHCASRTQRTPHAEPIHSIRRIKSCV